MHNVFVRLIVYVLSPLIAGAVAMIPGWGVTYEDGVVSVHIETLAAAVVAAAGLSGAVFARWGTR